MHERALALDLLLHHPIRRGNLSNLRLDLHFRRNDHGRITKLFIPAHEMKNGCDFHGVIPPELAARIDRHVKRFRPKLPGSGEPFLFPGGTALGQQRTSVPAFQIWSRTNWACGSTRT